MVKVVWKSGTMISPLPAALVSCGTMENPNVTTVSWTGIINSDPAITYVSIRPSRLSHELISQTKEFVINLTNLDLAEATDFCGVKSGRDVNKFQEMNLTPVKGEFVSAPCVEQSPVSIECRVIEVKSYGTHDMFIAEILGVQVDDKYIDEDGRLALEKAGILSYVHGEYYTLGRKLGSFGFSVNKKLLAQAEKKKTLSVAKEMAKKEKDFDDLEEDFDEDDNEEKSNLVRTKPFAGVVKKVQKAERKEYFAKDKEKREFFSRDDRDSESRDRKPYAPRDGGDRKPYAPRDGGDRKPYAPRDGGDRKPYAPRDGGDRKPYAPRDGGDRKPYAPRDGGDRKPYAPRDGGDRKPYAPRDGGDRKPYAPRDGGDRKPYAPRDGGDRKPYAPRDGGDRKPYAPRDGGDRKPYAPRDGGDRKPYAPRDGGDRKPYAPRDGGDRKPYAPRDGGDRRAPSRSGGGDRRSSPSGERRNFRK